MVYENISPPLSYFIILTKIIKKTENEKLKAENFFKISQKLMWQIVSLENLRNLENDSRLCDIVPDYRTNERTRTAAAAESRPSR
jgi:hypothetical protein